jgi:tRNA modification GTPase
MASATTDSIAAIATARGQSALAIVRISGSDAVEIAATVFSGASLTDVPANTVHFGYIRSGTGEALDQVLATVFRAPRSATGEDVVEFSCHGGDFAAQFVLDRLLESGSRMANPGEFTQRAFLNGKVDLAQAEAIADLIHASSSAAHRVSMAQLEGRYSALLESLRSELLELAAFVELELDFSDEDVEFADRNRLEQLLQKSTTLITRLLTSYRLGERIREGVRVVIGGRPNAGKSTLLNALVGFDRAIVSPTPGTTRDEIEAEAEIEGLRFRFFDTAGIRETVDQIEAEGVRRAHRAIEKADVLLYVFDASTGLDESEESLLKALSETRPDLPVLRVANKIDLLSVGEAETVPFDQAISASRALANEEEIAPLVRQMLDAVARDVSRTDASAVVTNQRHRRHLQTAIEAIERASAALQDGTSGDTLALDLRVALEELGAITGAITNEDVLDQIFSRFCIGK